MNEHDIAETAYKNGYADGISHAAKHGRWLMRGGRRFCSACQQRACVTRDTDDFWYTVGTDFCPNCGADMRGTNNENT